MNKHTLENLLIFSIVYCNTYKSNNGKPHPSYVGSKSLKYIGIDITEYPDITIDDFSKTLGHVIEIERVPILPHKILEKIKIKSLKTIWS